MRMKYILFLILLIFFIGFVSAEPLNISLEKNNYLSGETFRAEIGVNANLEDEIKTGDFELWQDNIKKTISPFLVRIDETLLFVYFDLPILNEGNVSFLVKDLVYLKNGILVKEDQSQSFDIIGNGSIITLNPAVIKIINFDEDTNYNIRIKNKEGHSIEISLIENYPFIYLEDYNFVLNPGEEKIFVLHIDPTLIKDEHEALVEIYYGERKYDLFFYLDYKDEVLVSEGIEDSEDIILPGKNVSFDISIGEYNEVIEPEEISKKGTIKIKNFGDENVSNIIFSLTGNLDEIVEINITKIDLIEPGEIVKQYIWINKEGDATEGEYSGNLVLTYGKGSDSWPMTIIVEAKDENSDKHEEISNESEDLNDTEYEDYEPPFDENKKGIGKWIWFLIIAGILAVLVFFYIKKKL